VIERRAVQCYLIVSSAIAGDSRVAALIKTVGITLVARVVGESLQRLLGVRIIHECVAVEQRVSPKGRLALAEEFIDRLRGFQVERVFSVRIVGRLRIILVPKGFTVRPFCLRPDVSWQSAQDQCGQCYQSARTLVSHG
jgi:hypothetical protein